MSVTLASGVAQTGRTAEDTLAQYGAYSLAAITAGLARECSQAIMRSPTTEEPAHALVCGKKTSQVRKRMGASARWVILKAQGTEGDEHK